MSPNVAMGRWPLRSAALKDPPSAQLLNRGAVVDDPVAPRQRPQRRSLRSPELQRRPPNRNITKKEAGAPPPARALAAGADVQLPGSCEQLDRPTADYRSARSANHSTGKLAARAGRAAPIFAKTKWSPLRIMLAVDLPARASAPLHQGIKTTIAPAGNVEARAWRRESAADHCVTTLKSDPVTVTDRVRHVPLFKKAEAAMPSDHRIYRRRAKRRRDKPPCKQTSTTRQHNTCGATKLDIFDVSQSC